MAGHERNLRVEAKRLLHRTQKALTIYRGHGYDVEADSVARDQLPGGPRTTGAALSRARRLKLSDEWKLEISPD